MDKHPIIIIMAGGLGKRMKSTLPKVLHTIEGKPMLARVISQANKFNPYKILIVVGQYKPIIQETIRKFISLDNIVFINQEIAMGTGHAIQCCQNYLKSIDNRPVLILSGDTPMIKNTTIEPLFNNFNKIKLLVTTLENPFGYGRIIEANNKFVKIVEEKDCSQEEQLVKKVNCGTYVIMSDLLCSYLPLLDNNNEQKEYYLTDIVEIIKINENIDIDLYELQKDLQGDLVNVNTKEQLEIIRKSLE
jgi:bifunctional UDP-N-acetylglucosamine pyrophosphorylase/glucosamine-1-phosphate N-acetyltransferase